MASLGREMRARSAWAPGAAITGHPIHGLSSATAPGHPPYRPMTTCFLAWALALLLLPVLVLLWATESRHTRIARWRRQGMTWKSIASRLNVSVSTARRWAVS